MSERDGPLSKLDGYIRACEITEASGRFRLDGEELRTVRRLLDEALARAERERAAADALAEAASRLLDVRETGGIGVKGDGLSAALAAYRAARGAR